MTLDTQFVKDNLPTPEEQLTLFKQILEKSNSQRNNILNDNPVCSFNWLSPLEVKKLGFTEKNKIIKLQVHRQIDKNSKIYDEENHKTSFLEAIWYNELVELGLEIFKLCDEKKTNQVSILKPEALLEKAYISFVEIENVIEFIGTVGIYFN